MPRKDPTKPKGRISAYAYFVKDKQSSVVVPPPKDGNNKAILAERSKILGEMWKKMSDEDKEEYQVQAGQDKRRYDKEMAKWKASGGADGGSKKRGKKAKKDPTKPKKNLTAFFFFSNKYRADIKAEFPDYKVGEVAKELGKRWSKLEDDEKVPFVKEAERDKERYEDELEQWKRGQISQVDEEEEEEDEEEDYSDAED